MYLLYQVAHLTEIMTDVPWWFAMNERNFISMRSATTYHHGNLHWLCSSNFSVAFVHQATHVCLVLFTHVFCRMRKCMHSCRTHSKTLFGKLGSKPHILDSWRNCFDCAHKLFSLHSYVKAQFCSLDNWILWRRWFCHLFENKIAPDSIETCDILFTKCIAIVTSLLQYFLDVSSYGQNLTWFPKQHVWKNFYFFLFTFYFILQSDDPTGLYISMNDTKEEWGSTKKNNNKWSTSHWSRIPH
jgi:hypothetical protein